MTNNVKIVQVGDPVLKAKARKVKKQEFGSQELRKVLDKMEEALESQYDGVALAAPQIQESLRIFTVSWKVFVIKDGIDLENISEEETLKELRTKYPNKIFINPEIIKCSKKTRWMDEGCLSVRPYYGEVERSEKCKVRAFDEDGRPFEIGGSGLLAQIFQHETDHLDGILFTDKARNVREFNPGDA